MCWLPVPELALPEEATVSSTGRADRAGVSRPIRGGTGVDAALVHALMLHRTATAEEASAIDLAMNSDVHCIDRRHDHGTDTGRKGSRDHPKAVRG
jgi:hypothetical protein